MKEPILITGCARSGTSLTAGIINICGAFGGEMTGTTRFNPKGQFEHSYIRQNIVKSYLTSINADPLGQYPLPDISKLTPVEDWDKFIINAVFKDVEIDERDWFYKGAKMCLIWKIWNFAFPNAKWIIVRRDKEKIAESCLRTSFMRAFNTKEDWISWVEEHEKRFEEMKRNCKNVIEINAYEATYEINFFREMILSLGLTWREDEVNEFIDQSLWNTQK